MLLLVPMVGDRRAVLILMLVLCSVFAIVSSIPVHGADIFTPETQFYIPEYNTYISYAIGGSYINASLIDNIWHFTGLIFEGATSIFPTVPGVDFSISTQDCNLTITRFDMLFILPPSSGWIEYTVSGVGNQTVNMHYREPRWLTYTVYIDGEEKAQNDGWSISDGGWLTVTGASSNVKIYYEQASSTMKSGDVFFIPEYNSSFTFEFDGTYVYATLAGNAWRFQNLIVDDHSGINLPIFYFAMSAHNCNVTITSYYPTYVSSGVKPFINYTVNGVGNQTFDNNWESSGGWINYTVIIDGVERVKNDGWIVTNERWVTVTDANSNATILYNYVMPDMPEPEPAEPEPTEPEPEEKQPTEPPSPKDNSDKLNTNPWLDSYIFGLFMIIAMSMIIVTLVLVLNRKRKSGKVLK